MGLGQRIKQAREILGWDQSELCKRSGVAQATLSAIETRDSNRTQYAEQLIGAFSGQQVDTYWLRTGKGTPQPKVGAVEPDYRASSLQPILSWEHEDELPIGEFVMIPRLNVVLSAGHGKEQIQLEFTDQQPQAFRADWIRREHLKPNKLAAMKADGDSMEPRIHDGDALVIDTSQNEVRDGRVYALWYDGGERVKRLFRLPGGGLRIHSDNESKYPDVLVKPDELEFVRIIGRVVHTAGTGGL